MQIANETALDVMAVPGYDRDGRESVTIIAKGTFSLALGCEPEPVDAAERLPIAMADEHWGEPGTSAVKYEAELAPEKPFADLVLLGHAYEPRGRPTKKATLSFRVGRFGATATVSSSEAMDAIPLHFLERPTGGVPWLRTARPKSGFGFYPKQCEPRVAYAGTYDEKWQDERAPFLPDDFDPRFFQVGFPELICDSYLRGGERIEIRGAAPGRPIETVVPRWTIEVDAYLEREQRKFDANLDTLVALPDQRKLALIWRALVPIGGAPSAVRGFRIRETSGALGAGARR
jgi:hypothetical protein